VRLLLWTALLGLCASPARADPADDEYLRLRGQSRELVNKSCGECHDGARKTAVPKALAVFDTRDADWTAHMSEKQLRAASGRLADKVVPTQAKEEAKPLSVSVTEKAQFDAFVTAEIAHRQGNCR
jgi:hypothetical protein